LEHQKDGSANWKQLLEQPWNSVRPGVKVKLLAHEGELYILAQSRHLAQLQQMHLSRDQMLIKLGQAKEEAGRAWKLVQITVAADEAASPEGMLHYRLNKERPRVVRRREGRYLLRSNLLGADPARLWEMYIQLTQIEEAFRNLKGDLAIRPIYHQVQNRIEAHIFIAFIAYTACT
jgi:transposase